MASNPRKIKIERLRAGKKPRVLDLFAGCGGLSLGFQSCGYEISAAVEFDKLAIASHAKNFFKNHPDELRERHSKPTDITEVEPADLCTIYSLGPAEKAVDFVIGGPPCQAFARVGRAKLREVAAHPTAFLNDPRSNLYLRFLHFIKAFQPVAILMENVPDVLNFGGHNIAEETCETLFDLGYTAKYTLINSAFYGVPQMRERMFLIAYDRNITENVSFPLPTHYIDLPHGYNGSRQVALKSLLPLNGGLFGNSGSYVELPKASSRLPQAVTASEALKDLPPITLHLEGNLKRGARRFTELIPYPVNGRLNKYASLMRKWPGFCGNGGVYDHVIRYLPRDYKIFSRMKAGDQYPEAYQLAVRMFEEALSKLTSAPKKGNKEYEVLMSEYVPPYDPNKFPNKWRKMEADQPARTLMAHLGKDSYSHIHYDSQQARTISVREAARLQSFPDGFVFEGTMNPAFRQIGNAVPPLLAKALAKHMLKTIRGVLNESKTCN